MPARPSVAAGPVRRFYWRLMRGGLSSEEAARATAMTLGLAPMSEDGPISWTVAEVERIAFLRWLWERGAIDDGP